MVSSTLPVLTTFTSPAGTAELRTLVDDKGEPWFVAKDICDRLGLSNITEALRGLDDDEKDGFRIPDSIGRKQMTPIINESGFYALVLKSRNPVAKAYRKWVTSEVLPSIRKHGMYATPDTLEQMLADPETTIKMLETIKAEREKSAALEGKIVKQKPKVELATALTEDMTLFHLSTIAREVGMGAATLSTLLTAPEHGILKELKYQGQVRRVPSPKSEELGYTVPVPDYHGYPHPNLYRFTPKGRERVLSIAKRQEDF